LTTDGDNAAFISSDHEVSVAGCNDSGGSRLHVRPARDVHRPTWARHEDETRIAALLAVVFIAPAVVVGTNGAVIYTRGRGRWWCSDGGPRRAAALDGELVVPAADAVRILAGGTAVLSGVASEKAVLRGGPAGLLEHSIMPLPYHGSHAGRRRRGQTA